METRTACFLCGKLVVSSNLENHVNRCLDSLDTEAASSFPNETRPSNVSDMVHMDPVPSLPGVPPVNRNMPSLPAPFSLSSRHDEYAPPPLDSDYAGDSSFTFSCAFLYYRVQAFFLPSQFEVFLSTCYEFVPFHSHSASTLPQPQQLRVLNPEVGIERVHQNFRLQCICATCQINDYHAASAVQLKLRSASGFFLSNHMPCMIFVEDTSG